MSSSLSKNTTYLILGNNPGPSKLSKAKILGVETISLQNLINKFNYKIFLTKNKLNQIKKINLVEVQVV